MIRKRRKIDLVAVVDSTQEEDMNDGGINVCTHTITTSIEGTKMT